MEEQRRIAEIRVQLHVPLTTGPAIDRYSSSLANLFDKLNRAGAETCFVEYPLSSVYRRAADTIEGFVFVRARLRKLAADKGVRGLNLTAAFPDTDFRDPDHVAHEARGRVTRVVIEECFGADSSEVSTPTATKHPSSRQ